METACKSESKMIKVEFWNQVYRESQYKINSLYEITGFYPPYYPQRRFHYLESFFFKSLHDIKGKKVLSLGGGIDKVALYLAGRGNEVTAIDISSVAMEKTARLAEKLNLQHALTTLPQNCEDIRFEGIFDFVIAHDSLHHMDVLKAVRGIHKALKQKGIYIGMEPICLSAAVRFLHKKFPFYSAPFMFISGEDIEFTHKELQYIKQGFSKVDLYFFDLFTRASVAYFLFKHNAHYAVKILSKLDYELIRAIPLLKALSSYVVVKAVK